MGLCSMIRWRTRRRRNIGIIMLLLLMAYVVNVYVFFKSNVQDGSKNEEQRRRRSDNEKDTIYRVQKTAGTGNAHHIVNNDEWYRKPYSPNAIFKDGVLGNYEPELDMTRTGPGEYGEPVPEIPSEKDEIERTNIEYGFNMVNSDKVSLDRVPPDLRHKECRYWHYPEKLPNASVVIVFHNEGWSTFVRTVHSVINMSPPQHLHEVVLVDDCSDKPHLLKHLEDYMAKLSPKVKIVRNPEREGLIRSRNVGALAATGEVIVFLDAHCECMPNWLPPLLTRIAHDKTIMAAPIVDGIDWTSYAFTSNFGNEPHRGIFEWGFFYKEIEVPKKELDKRKKYTEPYWSPTNAGGLFAINREYFKLLGTYDPQLEIWGGENFELAFKLWLCGGSSEWVPCSRVGHIYRHHGVARTFKFHSKLTPTLINYVRVAEVWMDEFKEYFYRREPQTRGYPVNITKEVKFRKDNQCKNFSWFMENVGYEIYSRFPPPLPNIAWGQISLRSTNNTQCMDISTTYKGKTAIGFYTCIHSFTTFRLNTKGRIGIGERCILALDDEAMTQEWCSTTDQSGPWEWDQVSGKLFNKDRNKCAGKSPKGGVHLEACDAGNPDQKWDIKEFYYWK